jgi:hypothetical protein
MPDHVHLGDDNSEPDGGRWRFARALACAARGLGRGVWDRIEEPTPIYPGTFRRFLRYLPLNPARPWSGGRPPLVDDPFEWPWTTYHDLLGATVDPWPDPGDLARRLGIYPSRLFEFLHRSVLNEGRLAPSAHLLPTAEPHHVDPVRGIEEIRLAVAAALRCDPALTHQRGRPRDLLIAAAQVQGWTRISQLARAIGIDQSAIRRRFADLPTQDPHAIAGLDAVLLCLGDERLTRHLAPGWVDAIRRRSRRP